VERYLSRIVFFIAMLFVLIAFFQTLGLTIITEPLNNLLNQVFIYAPRFIGAGLLLGLAWMLATILKFIVKKLLTTIKLDQRLSDRIEDGQNVGLSNTIAGSVYWLIFLLFLPAILNSLQMQGLLEPVQSMLDKILLFLPNLFTGGAILFVGWFVAKVIRKLVSNILAVVGINSLSAKVGLQTVLGKEKLSDLIGLISYILTLIPVLVIALDALMLEALTRPVSNMLNMILEVLPAIFAAFLIIFVAYVIAKLVSKLVASLLAGFGFDQLLVKLGVFDDSSEPTHKASEIVGYLTHVAILFVAAIEAFDVLGFSIISEIAAQFTLFIGDVVLGMIIFGFGLFIAKIVSNKILTKETAQFKMISLFARGTILFIAGAMSLQQMGISGEIVNLGFGLILGAVAVAMAVAFGIGGRDIAKSFLQKWTDDFNSKA